MKTINKARESSSANICSAETKKRKPYTPGTAGNKAFRLHNNIRFSRTAAEKEIGKSNKI